MTRPFSAQTAVFLRVAAAGWAVLAAVGVAGLASTASVDAGARQAAGGASRVERALAAEALAKVGDHPAVATVAARTGMAAEPANVFSGLSSYATGGPDSRAAVAVRVAMAQIGLPYVWGGDGPASGDVGFDCSGLTHYAYGVAEIATPRTAHTQFFAGPRVRAGAPLQPGDLVFYGTLAFVHHVGTYIGDGRMVNAPTFGEPVQTAYYRWAGDDFVGATRPAASSTGGSGALPFIPEPALLPASPGGAGDVFVAPRASLPSDLPAPGAVQVPEAQSAQQALTEQERAGVTAAQAEAQAGPTLTTAAPPPQGATVADGTALSTSGAPAAATGGEDPTTTAAAGPTTSRVAPTTTATPTTTVPPTTTVAPTTTTPPRTTTVPPTTTPPPTTTAAASTTTTVPPTTRPPPAPPPSPVAATPPARPSPAPRSAITVGGVPTTLATTAPGANGLPAAVGVWARAGRPVVRLAGASAVVGSTVTLQIGAGAAATYAVATSSTLPTAAAASVVAGAPAGELVILVPAAGGSWTVLTATS
jgi:cell wall-associated NlpC family hydrolase